MATWILSNFLIKDVDLIQFLSDWLTYAADSAKARMPQRVWKMFGYYFIKRFWKAKVTKVRMFHPPSTQYVKMVVYLRKQSHKRFSPRLWRNFYYFLAATMVLSKVFFSHTTQQAVSSNDMLIKRNKLTRKTTVYWNKNANYLQQI